MRVRMRYGYACMCVLQESPQLFFLAGQCLFKFSRTFLLLNRLRNYKSNILGFIHFYPKKKLFCNVSCCIYLCCVVNKVMMMMMTMKMLCMVFEKQLSQSVSDKEFFSSILITALNHYVRCYGHHSCLLS